MGSTRTFEEPGFMEEGDSGSKAALRPAMAHRSLLSGHLVFLLPQEFTDGISMAQLTFSTRSQLTSQPVELCPL